MSPERIYLRHYNDNQTSPIDPHTLRLWRLGDGDIEYIRADLACPRSSLASTPDLDREVLRKAVVSLQEEALVKRNSAYTDTSEASWNGEIDMAEKVLDLICNLLPPVASSGWVDALGIEAIRASFVEDGKIDARVQALIDEISRLRASLPQAPATPAAAPDLGALRLLLDDEKYWSKEGFGDTWVFYCGAERKKQIQAAIRALPSPAAPSEKGKEEGGPVATLPEASPRDPKLKVQRFKISPELVDGQHWSFCNTIEELVEVIRNWHENEPMTGDDFSVKVIEMSDEEFNAMPEI